MIVRIQLESTMIHLLLKNHFYFFNQFKTYEKHSLAYNTHNLLYHYDYKII